MAAWSSLPRTPLLCLSFLQAALETPLADDNEEEVALLLRFPPPPYPEISETMQSIVNCSRLPITLRALRALSGEP